MIVCIVYQVDAHNLHRKWYFWIILNLNYEVATIDDETKQEDVMLVTGLQDSGSGISVTGSGNESDSDMDGDGGYQMPKKM